MLKLPIGCAIALVLNDIKLTTIEIATIKRLPIALSSLPFGFDPRMIRLSFDSGQIFCSGFSENGMKIGIDPKRAGERLLGFGFFTEGGINHSCMKKYLRVLRTQSQCLIHRRSCLCEFSVSIKIPRHDVVGVNIAPVLQLAERKLQAFPRLDIVIGIKIG